MDQRAAKGVASRFSEYIEHLSEVIGSGVQNWFDGLPAADKHQGTSNNRSAGDLCHAGQCGANQIL